MSVAVTHELKNVTSMSRSTTDHVIGTSYPFLPLSRKAMGLYLLDYGAGNVQSLANTIRQLGHKFTWVSSPEDFHKATVSIGSIFLVHVLPIEVNPEPHIPGCRSI